MAAGTAFVICPRQAAEHRDLELQYRGRLDAARKDRTAEGLRRDLLEAMRQVARTGQGPQDQIPSMGCSIKWKAA
jgi:hypothetical protein